MEKVFLAALSRLVDYESLSQMAERGERGGFGRGFGRGRGDRGRGDRRGGRRGGRRDEEEKWVPVTKLGRLVKEGKIRSLEQIYLHSLPVKEHQIVEALLPSLKDEVMKIMPVQKQTRAGQRTRFKAFVVVGDGNGHVGLGVKCSKEVATAIRGAIILAKLSVIPVRRGYWGNKIGKPHTVPCKVTGKCGSVTVRMVPAPRGAGIVAARVPKKVLQFAGIEDVFTSSRGSTKTLGNFVKAESSKATFDCLLKTYGFLTPDFWRETRFTKSPFQEYTDLLAKSTKAIILDDSEQQLGISFMTAAAGLVMSCRLQIIDRSASNDLASRSSYHLLEFRFRLPSGDEMGISIIRLSFDVSTFYPEPRNIDRVEIKTLQGSDRTNGNTQPNAQAKRVFLSSGSAGKEFSSVEMVAALSMAGSVVAVDSHLCASCLCTDALSPSNGSVRSGCDLGGLYRNLKKHSKRLELSSSFVNGWDDWRLSTKVLSGGVACGGRSRRQRRRGGRGIVNELGGQYEDTFDDVTVQILNYFTYKAVRTVLHQLYEMNPPQYRWFYNFVATNKPGDAKRFIRALGKESQELAERVMITRLHLYGMWIKKCDHSKMYKEISDQNLELMRERLMETVVWPSDDTNTEKFG
ncbi:hypothetical protein ACLOJK_016087 [Asimina triloba]